MTRFIEINTRTIAVDSIVMIDQPTASTAGYINLTQGARIPISGEQWDKLKEFFSVDCTSLD